MEYILRLLDDNSITFRKSVVSMLLHYYSVPIGLIALFFCLVRLGLYFTVSDVPAMLLCLALFALFVWGMFVLKSRAYKITLFPDHVELRFLFSREHVSYTDIIYVLHQSIDGSGKGYDEIELSLKNDKTVVLTYFLRAKKLYSLLKQKAFSKDVMEDQESGSTNKSINEKRQEHKNSHFNLVRYPYRISPLIPLILIPSVVFLVIESHGYTNILGVVQDADSRLFSLILLFICLLFCGCVPFRNEGIVIDKEGIRIARILWRGKPRWISFGDIEDAYTTSLSVKSQTSHYLVIETKNQGTIKLASHFMDHCDQKDILKMIKVIEARVRGFKSR